MKEKSCSVKGCPNIAIAKSWCNKHYKRFYRHGHILFTRQSDWGTREKHPLYKAWTTVIRYHSAGGGVCKEWAEDFWKFVESVKERPEGNFRFTRKDESKPFSPENWYWRFFTGKTDEEKKNSKLYTNKWRKEKTKSDPDFEFNQRLKKHFKITTDDYFEMHKKQNGVCAICEENEKAISHRSGHIMRLAVDHCHTTGKIRGLLCSACNKSLGGFKDSAELLNKAINYLGG